jgi:hypothetical protein
LALFGTGWVLLAAGMISAPGSAIAQGGYQQATVSNGGKITGQVKFDGPIPEPYVIWVKKDAEVFGAKVPDERLLISKDGKLQNVVVMLEGITPGKAWPTVNPTLENRGGRFIPHVQAAPRGASLEVVNGDPVLHNTHGFQESRTVFNLALPNTGQRIKQTLRRAGIIEVMCDSHDWMNGWVLVLDHPYFAVTGKDGTFEITDVPPGAYKLTAWHEKLGRLEQQVTVTAGKVAQSAFTFRPSAGTAGKTSGK